MLSLARLKVSYFFFTNDLICCTTICDALGYINLLAERAEHFSNRKTLAFGSNQLIDLFIDVILLATC